MPALSRPVRRAPRLDEVFTDRAAEAHAFRDALAAHRRAIDGPVDDGCARNVLVFYGEGGMGKSSLAERLRRWVAGELPLDNDGWGPPPPTAVTGVVTVDPPPLAARFDLAETLFEIRRRLGAVTRHWPAFDLAFAAYWAAARPEQEFPLAHTDVRELVDATADIFADITGDLSVLMGQGAPPVPGGTLAVLGRLGYRVVEALRGRRVRHDVAERYEGFDEIFTACATQPSSADPRLDVLVRTAQLLDAEIAHTVPTPLVVVFVDHFERLAEDPRREGEGIVNELAWLMPHVLFVVSGRTALSWGREDSPVPYAGPGSWPQLVLPLPDDAPEPRQHLVGYLGPRDRREVMRRAREAYGLNLSAELADEVAELSGGRPLHLELLVTIAREAGSHRTPELADFEGTATRLVGRIMSYIPADQQRVIRAGALFPYFSTGLVAAAAGVDAGAAARAVLQPLITTTGRTDFPSAMHDEVRSALRAAGPTVEHGWTGEDWRGAATRALRELRQRFDRASAGGPTVESLDLLGLAITVVCLVDADLEPADARAYRDWLSKAIVFAPSIAGLRSRVPATASTAYGQAVLRFIAAKTPEHSTSERVGMLRELFESDHPLARPAGRHLAYTLRDCARWDEAIEVFDRLIEQAPSGLHRLQRATTLVMARRFADARAGIAELDKEGRSRIRAMMHVAHGRPEEWISTRPALLARKLAARKHREYVEVASGLLRMRALVSGGVDVAEAERALAEAESLGHSTGVRDALTALLLLSPEAARPGDARFDRLLALDAAPNDGELGFRSGLVLVVGAFVRDDRQAMRAAAERIAARRIPLSRSWIPVECLSESLDLPLRLAPAQWLEPVEVVRDRWRAIFDAHRARLRAG